MSWVGDKIGKDVLNGLIKAILEKLYSFLSENKPKRGKVDVSDSSVVFTPGEDTLRRVQKTREVKQKAHDALKGMR